MRLQGTAARPTSSSYETDKPPPSQEDSNLGLIIETQTTALHCSPLSGPGHLDLWVFYSPFCIYSNCLRRGLWIQRTGRRTHHRQLKKASSQARGCGQVRSLPESTPAPPGQKSPGQTTKVNAKVTATLSVRLPTHCASGPTVAVPRGRRGSRPRGGARRARPRLPFRCARAPPPSRLPSTRRRRPGSGGASVAHSPLRSGRTAVASPRGGPG